MRLMGFYGAGFSASVLLSLSVHGQDVLTYHNDNHRTGQNLSETILRPKTVTKAHFGLQNRLAVDGGVYAQPLYAAGVQIPGKGLQNVLYVVTEHDSVYAFNADGTNILWKKSVLGPGETPSDKVDNCGQVPVEIGITATPVIDRQAGSNGVIFVVAMSKTNTSYIQRIHALDLATGRDVVAPASVEAEFPGTGDNSSGGEVIFDPMQYKERCGLLLVRGILYTTWASHCDRRPYTGWLIGYNEYTLLQTSVVNITPNGNAGAFWGSGAGVAADGSGNIYALAGNGTFDTNLVNGFPSQGDYGNCFIKYATTNHHVYVADYFAMSNSVAESAEDTDLGSGGAVVLPGMLDASGQGRELVVGGGKDSILYVVDRNNMGHFNSKTNKIWQQVNGAVTGGLFSSPAYYHNTLYLCGNGGTLRAYPMTNARVQAMSSQTANSFKYPGATPSITANGNRNGIVWAALNGGSQMTLYAYNAANLAQVFYTSADAGTRDQVGPSSKGATPTIANGRVYVDVTNGVAIFGLLDTEALTPLEKWRNAHFGNPSSAGGGSDGATPANDGAPNIVKYALGLNPLEAADSTQLPFATLTEGNGSQYLTLTVNRATNAPEVGYEVEVSSDLTHWSSGGANTVVLRNTPRQLVVRDATPATAARERFIRLVITSQEEEQQEQPQEAQEEQ